MKLKKLKLFEEQNKDCKACSLSASRTQVVFGQGNSDTSLMIIGEAPGQEEDEQGKSFMGKEAGQLFDKILASVNINREEIWITNACMCRTPEDRAPYAKEIKACGELLLHEIFIIHPKVIVIMGNVPLFSFTKRRGITKNRGWIEDSLLPIPIYATLHPASLLHGGEAQIEKKKHMVWEDWKAIKVKLEELGD